MDSEASSPTTSCSSGSASRGTDIGDNDMTPMTHFNYHFTWGYYICAYKNSITWYINCHSWVNGNKILTCSHWIWSLSLKWDLSVLLIKGPWEWISSCLFPVNCPSCWDPNGVFEWFPELSWSLSPHLWLSSQPNLEPQQTQTEKGH